MSDATKSKAKQKWAIVKPELDNARKLRGIFFIGPDVEQFKRFYEKIIVESLKFRCQQQCLVKPQ